MLEKQTALINEALGTCFDRVLDLFDEINMSEHKNELLCFTGIDGYKLSEPVGDGNGSSMRTAEVKYLIKAVGKKNMSAAYLCALFDDEAIPAVESCGVDIRQIKRNPCAYSKEQGAYTVSAELTVITEESEESVPEIIDFNINGRAFEYMRSFEISRAVKTAETSTIGGGIRSRVVGKRPLSITVKGEISADTASAVYSLLTSWLGISGLEISVGGISFGGMAMTGLDLGGSVDGSAKLTVEFTEVTEN